MENRSHLAILLHSTEGRLLLVGFLLMFGFTLFLIYSWIFLPDLYQAFTAVGVTHLLFGRAAGISVGFASELTFWHVIWLNFFIETVVVLIVYPLFVLSWNELFHAKRLAGWMEASRKTAVKYRPLIQRYGVYGLFIFVWFPFWMTGPVIGSMIGYLMGLSHRITLLAVLSGTFIATVCWAYFLAFLHDWAETFDAQAPWMIAGSIILLVAVATALRYLTKRGR